MIHVHTTRDVKWVDDELVIWYDDDDVDDADAAEPDRCWKFRDDLKTTSEYCGYHCWKVDYVKRLVLEI